MRHYIILLYVFVHQRLRNILLSSVFTMKFLYLPGFAKIRMFNAKARAYSEFCKARKKVPAYRDFLISNGFLKPSFNGIVPNIHEIPFTDKSNYINKYELPARCVHGRIPNIGVIDESSGRGGTATNWVRGAKERRLHTKFVQLATKSLVGNDVFVINAFSMGPWAAGINSSVSLMTCSIVKSLGPDSKKILRTLKDFGSSYKYVIVGYPPFLKLLVQNSDIDWKKYDVSFVFGGESMSEGMRDYLLKKGIKKVYSNLGISDLELSMSLENDFTISLRKLIKSNEVLRSKILKHGGDIPMVFQFSPTDFWIESSSKGDLIVTICRPNYVAPKIRYNVYDRGHVLQIKELYKILESLEINTESLCKPKTDLPILFHYGRSDMTVSFFGANIGPTDIQDSIFKIPELEQIVNSFSMGTHENQDGDKTLILNFEIQKDKNHVHLDKSNIKKTFIKVLSNTNNSFARVKELLSNDDQISLNFHEYEKGPFKGNINKIKANYID